MSKFNNTQQDHIDRLLAAVSNLKSQGSDSADVVLRTYQGLEAEGADPAKLSVMLEAQTSELTKCIADKGILGCDVATKVDNLMSIAHNEPALLNKALVGTEYELSTIYYKLSSFQASHLVTSLGSTSELVLRDYNQASIPQGSVLEPNDKNEVMLIGIKTGYQNGIITGLIVGLIMGMVAMWWMRRERV